MVFVCGSTSCTRGCMCRGGGECYLHRCCSHLIHLLFITIFYFSFEYNMFSSCFFMNSNSTRKPITLSVDKRRGNKLCSWNGEQTISLLKPWFLNAKHTFVLIFTNNNCPKNFHGLCFELRWHRTNLQTNVFPAFTHLDHSDYGKAPARPCCTKN